MSYEDAENLRGELRQLETLEKDPSFLVVVSRLQEDINSMQMELVMKPAPSLDSCLQQEYRKGQIEGRMSLAVYIEQRKETLKYEIEQLMKEVKNDE